MILKTLKKISKKYKWNNNFIYFTIIYEYLKIFENLKYFLSSTPSSINVFLFFNFHT